MKTRKLALGSFTAVAIMLAVASTAYACSVNMGGTQHDFQVVPNVGDPAVDTLVVGEGFCDAGLIGPPSCTTAGDPSALVVDQTYNAGSPLSIETTSVASFPPGVPPCTPVVGVPPACPPYVTAGHVSASCNQQLAPSPAGPPYGEWNRIQNTQFVVGAGTIPANLLMPGVYRVCFGAATPGLGALLWNFFTAV